MWYEIKIKADEINSEAINSILYEMDASGIIIEDSSDKMFDEGYEGDWDYFGIDTSTLEQGYYIKAYVEFAGCVDDDLQKKTRTNYACMSREISTLSGELDFTKVTKKYQNIENWVCELKRRIEQLQHFGLDVHNVNVEYKIHEEIDYVAKWMQDYHPFEIAPDIWICPTWLKGEFMCADAQVIYLDPGAAFGTGTHESTKLCANLLAKYVVEMDKKLCYDIGTGSGILAIIAHKLGFKRVIATDIDENAVKVARENACFNGASGIEFQCADLTNGMKQKADMIIANIIADVILQMADDVKDLINEHGWFLASGIIDEKYDEVLQTLQQLGFSHVETMSQNGWNSMMFRLE